MGFLQRLSWMLNVISTKIAGFCHCSSNSCYHEVDYATQNT